MSKPRRLFAQGTTVPVERSRAEIEKLLSKHGATSFVSGWEGERATILFQAHARRVRFDLQLQAGMDAKEQAENRRRWRGLAFIIKAKLEAVAEGLVTFEEEFLAHIILPGTGETMGQWAGPQIAAAYERGGNMPKMLGVGR